MTENLLPNRDNSQGWKKLLDGNDTFLQYGSNAIGLLALTLKFNIDDISYAGADSIVDGSNDKKNDFVYIDEENGFAVIIQAYFAKISKQIAPANKASDLNTAVLWLLSADEKELPDGIKNHSLRLRGAIENGSIKKLHVWYVHNCTESSNVKKELDVVERGLKATLKNSYKNNKIETFVLEVGASTLSEWYLQSFSPIYVSDEIKFNCNSGFCVDSEKWGAFVTSLNATELYCLYKKHKSALFSANVRDYLGDREADSNINSGIKNSIERSPSEFWAYNNGLTILTNNYHFDDVKKELKISGMSIVNGAQTTGAIGNLKNPPKNEAKILVRFIKVNNSSRTLIGNIVKFNNFQNKVDATDFRSNDAIQKRLTAEISAIDKKTIYQGGRRGGDASAIKRNKNSIPSFTLSQALTAFHVDPLNAYGRKSRIWTDDQWYSRVFNEKNTGSHILFIFSLFKIIETIKINLINKSKECELVEVDQEKLNFFRKSGSIFVYMYALSQCMEMFVEKPINDKFTLNFGNRSLVQCIESWDSVIDLTLPLVKTLDKGLSSGLNEKNINSSVGEFKQVLEVVLSVTSAKLNRFSKNVRFK